MSALVAVVSGLLGIMIGGALGLAAGEDAGMHTTPDDRPPPVSK